MHFSPSERSEQVRVVFEQAVDLAPEERGEMLDATCGGDPALRRQVEALLAVDAQADVLLQRFVSSPALPDDARWEKLERFFDLVKSQSPEQRPVFLQAVCGSDVSLRAELASLLAHHEAAPRYLDDLVHAVGPAALRRAAAGPSVASGGAEDPLVGRSVTHYEILERLGGGGMGVVYKARDLRLDRIVALKFLPPHLGTDAEARLRFVHEAKAASALDHVNLGYVHEIDETADGRLFIAMAYYAGETLKHKIERGPLSAEEALSYAVQMAAGLARAHAAGIVHRDVKPANVMVTREGVVKIVDFGLAKMHDVTLTQTGATVGTLAYMSPEQVRGEAVDHRTDIWSLGVVLYEMLGGARPFRAPYEQALRYALANEEPAPVASLNPDLPAALVRIVSGCLQKDSEARYQQTSALRDDLMRVQRGEAEALEEPAARLGLAAAPAAPAVRPRFGKRSGLALGAAGAVLLALLLGWLARDRLPEARHLAVLPFQIIGEMPDAQAYSAGLVETLTSKLTQLEQFHGALWVVPASEVGEAMTPSQARDRFGVTMVVTGSIQHEGDRARLTLNLIDAATRRQLSSEQLDYRSASVLALQDEAILMLARMLQVRLEPQARRVLAAGGTAEPQANDFYLRGRGYLRQYQSVADLDVAIRLFETAIAQDPQFALAHAGLGEAYWLKYHLTDDVQWVEAAVASSERALQLNDQLAPVYVTLGIIRSGQQQYEEALQAFQKALELDPFDAEAYRRRAAVYRRQGRFAEAEEAYRQAIALKPDYWRGYSGLGVFYYATGRYEEAIAQFNHGLQLAPANPSLLNNLGATYWQLERLGEAVATFERVLQADPSNARATSNLATAYFYQGRYDEAARRYEQELALRPHDYAMQGFLADTYHWMPGARDRAQHAYRKAIAMARQHLAVGEQDPSLLGYLASYYARLGKEDSARVFLGQMEALLQPAQMDVVNAFGVGEIYEQLGDRARAAEWMESALERGYGWMQVQHSPWLADLRRDPSFQALLARHR